MTDVYFVQGTPAILLKMDLWVKQNNKWIEGNVLSWYKIPSQESTVVEK